VIFADPRNQHFESLKFLILSLHALSRRSISSRTGSLTGGVSVSLYRSRQFSLDVWLGPGEIIGADVPNLRACPRRCAASAGRVADELGR
jgi:hypothetical protein